MSRQPHSHLAGIVAFVTTVEQGSFTAAAARMGLSKSAVAKTVARLEERLGIRLLDRTTRRVGLTVEGHVYHDSCLRILSELQDTEAVLASRQHVASGVLRVSLPTSFGPRWAVPALLEILREFPQLTLDASFTDRHVDLIEDGIDLTVRIGEMADASNLVARKIGMQHSLVCASPDYLAMHGAPASPGDIHDHDCIGDARAGRVLPWYLLGPHGKVEKISISPRNVISNGDAMRNAALAGAGLAYLPTWLIHDDLMAGRLVAVLRASGTDDRPIHLVWPRQRDVLPKIRVVVDALVRRFVPVPPWAVPPSPGDA